MIRTLQTYFSLRRAEHLSLEKTKEIQERRLIPLLQHAYREVPYYQKLFQQAGIRPEDVQRIEELPKIPLSRKGDIAGRPPEELMSRSKNKNRISSVITSGSSGEPLTIMQTPEEKRYKDLLFLAALREIGLRLTDRVLLITDPRFHSPKTQQSTFRLGPLRFFYASLFENGEELLKMVRQLQPDVVYGPLSNLLELAEATERTKGPIINPRIVVSTAEMCDQLSRSTVNNAFQTEMFNFYGMTEMGMFAWECSREHRLHVREESVLVEMIPLQSDPSLHELVCTNLFQHTMPFIRYATGDYVQINNTPCPCGITLPVIEKIHGREVDCIELPNGERISPYLLTCTVEKIPGIKRYQITFQKGNQCNVMLQEGMSFSSDTTEQLRTELRHLLGEDISVHLHSGPIRKNPAREARLLAPRTGSNR